MTRKKRIQTRKPALFLIALWQKVEDRGVCLCFCLLTPMNTSQRKTGVTSRMSSFPSFTFSVAPTTSWWMLSISVSCHGRWDQQSVHVWLRFITHTVRLWKRSQLTCCRTFSAKISWSREISTTFPSICLMGTKAKRETSHENSVPGVFKPFQMALVLLQKGLVISLITSGPFWYLVPSGTNMPAIVSDYHRNNFICRHLRPWLIWYFMSVFLLLTWHFNHSGHVI